MLKIMVASMRFLIASSVLLIAVLLGSCGITAPTLTGTVTTSPPLTPSLPIEIKPTNSTSEPIPLDTVSLSPILDPAYYDGIIVITQYYTLFGHGLYEEAYQLLSTSRPHAISLEEFVTNSKILKITKSEVVSIQPYFEPISQFQARPTPDFINRGMFYTRIYTEGENGWAGSVPNGVHTYYISTVLENGEWKIYSINTSP